MLISRDISNHCSILEYIIITAIISRASYQHGHEKIKIEQQICACRKRTGLTENEICKHFGDHIRDRIDVLENIIY